MKLTPLLMVEQSKYNFLNICEDEWHHQLNAQINIQNMILLHMRLTLLSFVLSVDVF